MAKHPYVPGINVAQVDMIYALGSNRTENVYHVLGSAAWTPTLLTNLLSAFTGWEADVAYAQRSDQIALVEAIATDLTTQSSARVTTTAGMPINGGLAGLIAPQNVTWAIKANTAKRGRSYRGRSYWIGLLQTDAPLDLLGQGRATAITAAMNNLLTLMGPVNGGQMVVFSQMQNGVWLNPGISTPITNYSYTDLVVDSQRRRLTSHNVHR